jgi:hypothetical protein
MKYLFVFNFALETKATGDLYSAVHGFSYENPNDLDLDPFEFQSQMEDKWNIIHDGSGDILPNIDINGFTTYEAESYQIKEIMKDWHDHFVSLGLKCSRVHFLGILSETGKQYFTEENYLRFHEKWTAKAA